MTNRQIGSCADTKRSGEIMAYEKIESHDEYLKTVEQYQDYEAGTYQSMTLDCRR